MTRLKQPPMRREPAKAPVTGDARALRGYGKIVNEALELAHIYQDDGALCSAAREYRKAATYLEHMHTLRGKMLDAAG